MHTLQYPIGKFNAPQEISETHIADWIKAIQLLPEKLKAVTQNFTSEQWKTTYRPGGWTAQQVVHHIADSHMNSIIRFKWALTENAPQIKTYHEKLWSELPDVFLTPPEISLNLIDFLHQRWVVLLQNFQPQDFDKSYVNPETQRIYDLKTAIGLYAWHGNHHLAHLKLIAEA